MAAAARLTLRVDFGGGRALGPGKVRLLELIDRDGSISAAARAMRMSYRRAWLLIDAMNRDFREPMVTTQLGGSGGGGAALSELGRAVVASYRAIEAGAAQAASSHLAALEASLADDKR